MKQYGNDVPVTHKAAGPTSRVIPGKRMSSPATLKAAGPVTPAPVGHTSAGIRSELGKLGPEARRHVLDVADAE